MPEDRYRVVRMYLNDHPRRTIKTGLTLAEAQEHCRDPETSSRTCRESRNVRRTKAKGPWFDGFETMWNEFDWTPMPTSC